MTREKSDLSRAFAEDGARKTHVGGQALLEGIMMRGKYNWSVAVREPSGAVYTEEHDLASGKEKNGCTGRSCADAVPWSSRSSWASRR